MIQGNSDHGAVEARQRANRAYLLLERLKERGFSVASRDGKLMVNPGNRLLNLECEQIRELRNEMLNWLDDPIAYAVSLADEPDWSRDFENDRGAFQVVNYTILTLDGCAPVAVPEGKP